MIEEFTRSYPLHIQIKCLVQEGYQRHKSLDVVSSSVIPLLGQLVGISLQHNCVSSCLWSKGPLTKLKEYCELFSSNSRHKNKPHVDLYIASHYAWMKALYAFESMSSLYAYSQSPQTLSTSFLMPLKQAFEHLHHRFNKIIHLIPRVSNSFWNNENVILCLLRKKSALEEIYGEDYLHKQFKCPIHPSELNAMLNERYQARGFDALMPTIQSLFKTEEAIAK